MNLRESHYTIASLKEKSEGNALQINADYQRHGGLWPSHARTYFIDTILEDFPFPKLYFYENTQRKSDGGFVTHTEVVDGQQRLKTIIDFVDNKIKLGATSSSYKGMRFADLDEDVQGKFMGYQVAVDVITRAQRTEILEMFRRMNAYTLPLNEAEKRHSKWGGEFKWFVNNVADEYSAKLNEFGVLTQRQIIRMRDAEFITDLIAAIDQGITNTTPSLLSSYYRNYDKEFDNLEYFYSRLSEALDYCFNEFSELRDTYLFRRPFVFHDLCIALLHNKYGLPNTSEKIGVDKSGKFANCRETAVSTLEALAHAHESKDAEGPYAEYVAACSEGANREKQRIIRTQYLIQALNSN